MADFRFVLDPTAAQLPQCSAVLNGRVSARDYVVNRYRTTLSVKSVTRGSAVYRTPRGHFRLEPDCFLVLNHGQEYSMEIEGGSDTETLCPFFQPSFLEHVAGARAADPARQLDELDPAGPADFFERLYPKTGAVAQTLARLAQGLHSPVRSRAWLEDELFRLAEGLLALRGETRRETEGFPGSRPSTRAELYRRLHRARDFLDSCYTEPLTVSAVARVACLSPYHFQRMFRLAFGTSPMQHLQARRLLAARGLLTRTDMDVTAVCFAVGFESLGSFSWLFRRRYGASPRAFRRGQATHQNRRIEEVS